MSTSGVCCLDSSGVKNRLDFANHEVQLLIFRVKMWRDADSGARTVIHQEIAAQQFASDVLGLRNVQRHRTTALGPIARRVDAEPSLVRELDQTNRLAERFCADVLHADLVDDFITRSRGVERGNRGSAAQEAEGILGIVDRKSTRLTSSQIPLHRM